MGFIKRFLCTHEIDLDNLDKPTCVKCGHLYPAWVSTGLLGGYKPNPELQHWIFKKNLPKYAKIIESMKKVKDD